MRLLLSSLLLVLAFTLACSSKRPETSEPEKHYALSGEILSLNAKTQTANINAAAIPNYMEAMAMDYPVKTKAEFSKLHVGDKITATLNVSASGDEYNLSNVQTQSRSK